VKDKESLTAKRDRICAVVVTFNRKILLEECLTALLSQTRPLEEIIVIDNASIDGTDALIKACFPTVTYVRLDENVGGAGGFHEGMKLAFEKGYDWIWVMDDDAVPMADALEKLANSPMIHQSNVYALASTVIKQDGSIFLIHRRLFDASKLEARPIEPEKYKGAYFRMDTASFVGVLISHKAIEEVGLPLKSFFIYYDDTEYSLRIRERGIMVTVCDSKVSHPQSCDDSNKSIRRQQPLTWRDYYSLRNQIYTYIKYGKIGPNFYLKLFVGNISGLGGILLFRRSKVRSSKVLICSTLDGLLGRLGKNRKFVPN